MSKLIQCVIGSSPILLSIAGWGMFGDTVQTIALSILAAFIGFAVIGCAIPCLLAVQDFIRKGNA